MKYKHKETNEIVEFLKIIAKEQSGWNDDFVTFKSEDDSDCNLCEMVTRQDFFKNYERIENE